MSENSEVMVIDEIIDNMEIDDVLEEIEDIENPVVELEVDSEFEVIDKRQSLQESYNEYNESYVELSELLRTILATGEYTEENKQQILETNDVYDEKYRTVVKEMDKAKSTIESNKALDFNGSILMNTQDDVFNALTKNGEVQAIYRDSEGKIYINAQYLQTRGLTVVNDNNQVTLKIDNKGNLTTSGDIVGGTITGSVMKAMTINTNEVNITSNDGGMSINGALQKFSDERGNVRILIGKDTDGSFKFMLYGENGSTVLIDKNGIKSEAISAGTIKTDHLAPNSISTKHLKTEVMEVVDAKVENMTADKATIGQLNATNAQISQLNANKANVSDLTATNAKVENLTANKANVSDLNATNATVSNLKAETAKINQAVINKADIGQLNATNANIGILQANVAKIDNVLAGNITSENIQAGSITSKDFATGTITAGSGIIANGAIGSAQISSVDAGKVSTGKLDTGKVTVAGANNHLKIQGNRLQVFQGTGNSAKERVSLGDVNGDGTIYGLRVRGADGKTVLMDENGVKSEGITDGSITNDKISDNADIDGAKLNINSVINKINQDGTETINGTKIEVNGQTLNAQLSTITNKQNEDGKKITQAQSQISANTQSIGLKVDSQTYQTDKKNMTSQMNKNTSEISAMKGQIALKVERTDIEDAKSDMAGTIDSKISSAKGEIKVTTDKISQSVSNLTQTVNKKADNSTVTSVSNKVASLETNLSGITQRVSSTETKTETLTSDMSKVDGKINTAKQSAITTASNDATTKANNALANAKSYTNGEITKTNNAVSEINTSLSGITQRVSKVETSTTTLGTKIDNIQVGGRNYIKNSQKVYMKPNGTNNHDLTFKLCDSFWENSSRFGIVTISFDVKADSALSEDFSSNIWFRAEPWYSFSKWTYPKGTTNKKSYSLQLDLKSMATSYKTTELFVRFQAKDTVGMTFTNVKLEIGTKKTDWTPAPEDTAVEIEEKINSAKAEIKTTTDSISQSVSNLTSKVNTKADGSTVSTLNNKVGTLETNLNGITQRVSATESTTSTLTNKVNTAQSTADSKAKVFTSTPTTPYKVGDLWVQGSTGDVMKCKTARSSGNYVASDWEKASKYTDDTKANAVDGKVTTLQGTVTSNSKKVATLETNLNSITQRVQDTETTTSTLTSKVDKAQSSANSAQSTANSALSTANTNKSNITSLTTRVSTAESKLTKDSLTTTIGKHYATSSDVDGIVTSKGYQTQSQVQQTVNSLQAKFTSSGGYNLLKNTGFKNGLNLWGTQSHNSPTGGEIGYIGNGAEWSFPSTDINTCQIRLSNQTSKEYGITQSFKTVVGKKYTVSFYYAGHRVPNANLIIRGTSTSTGSWLTSKGFNPTNYSGGKTSIDKWGYLTHTFTATLNTHTLNIVINNANNDGYLWIAQPQIEEGEMPTAYSPHTSEVYDGITQIDKDGIKVMQSGINGHTHMTSKGFYVQKDGTDVVKVTSDGVYIKGRVDITGGSVPTSSLSGTIASSQLNSTITGDINTAKNNASTALSTANTAKTTADSAKSTATNAQNTANTAKSTADNANTTASAVKKTVDANSTNWSNAYNRVKEWANGAVTGSTSINGGMIATNTITANKIAVGDFNNYSQLQKGRNLTNSYGNAIWSESNAEWTTSNAYFPFTLDNTDNAFNVGDKINIKCSVWVNQSASLPIGV
nr:MAG TPA: Putative tail protein [Caudoviricetes sp.]